MVITPHGAGSEAWPALPLAAWQDTYATLHRWTQVVGKIRLALSPPVNHWWHTALYVTARGLTTSPIPHGDRTFEIEFDFVDHQLRVPTSDGASWALPLGPRSVADFYQEVMATLAALDLPVRIWPVPAEMPGAARLDQDTEHAAYDPEYAHRHWRVLVQTDRVLKIFRGRFIGKVSPVHFFWGGFDMAVTRFSGRRAPVHPSTPGVADVITHEGYSHEVSSAGFWPGGEGLPEPIYYAYAYPEPAGFGDAPVPAEASYNPTLGEFVLPYAAVRQAPDPDALLLDFLQATCEAAADRGGWDRAALERTAPGTAPPAPQ
ncbi:MAG TPA: DUF5996 family protein [Chloroflexota bacterium]|jgi:hypothetical protein